MAEQNDVQRGFASMTVSGEPGLIAEITRAMQEVLTRFDLNEVPELGSRGDVGRWEQEGGWYLDAESPWSQKGGWVLDLEGQITTCSHRPSEALVRDVWAALDRVKPDPNWEQAWGPLPQPDPGPCPGGPVG